MNISLFAFAPEISVSRDGFASPVPRQPAHLHTWAESGDFLGSAYLRSMDCQRESQSKHPTGENPGIYTVGVPFLIPFWDRVLMDAAASGHADMVMYCLESSRQYPEWEYKHSTMLAAASEQRWHVSDAFDIHCRSINCCTAIP